MNKKLVKATVPPTLEAPPPGSSVFDRDKQYAMRRKAILQEAGRVFEELGPQEFSMTALAAHLNITTPALYYYFKSKKEMLYECYKISLDIGEKVLEAAKLEGGNSAQILERFLYLYLVNGFTELTPTMVLRDHISLTPQFQKKLTAQRDALQNKLRELIGKGIEENVITPCNPKFAATSITGVAALVIRAYNPRGKMTAEQLAQQTVRMLTRGLFSECGRT